MESSNTVGSFINRKLYKIFYIRIKDIKLSSRLSMVFFLEKLGCNYDWYRIYYHIYTVKSAYLNVMEFWTLFWGQNRRFRQINCTLFMKIDLISVIDMAIYLKNPISSFIYFTILLWFINFYWNVSFWPYMLAQKRDIGT